MPLKKGRRMFLIRLQIFIKSLWFHIYGGFPKSTQKEILDRYHVCETCEEFNANKEQCNVCGCYLSKKKKFLNKLAWADQECPIGKWPKIQR